MVQVLFQELQAGNKFLRWDEVSDIEIVDPRFTFAVRKEKNVARFLLVQPRAEDIFGISLVPPEHVFFELEKRESSIVQCRGFIREYPYAGNAASSLYMLQDSAGMKFGWPNFAGDWLEGALWIIFEETSNTPVSVRKDLHLGVFRSDKYDKRFLIFSYRGGIHQRAPYYFLVLAMEPLERQYPQLQYFIPEPVQERRTEEFKH